MSKKISRQLSFRGTWGPINIGLVVYMSLGYCVRYFSEFVFVISNESEFIRSLTNTIPALQMVDRVAQLTGGNPAPMKMLVAYAIVGSLILAVWCVFWSLQKDILHEMAFRFESDRPSNWRLLMLVLVIVVLYVACLHVMNMERVNVSRQDVSWFSRSLSSATVIMLLNGGAAAICVMVAPILYVVFFVKPKFTS
ncbi:hypothetical protein WJ803_20625 [Pseudomonas veronii]|uniref:hypothetical protein n=1 Tax=Pseudomonas veronii TaxID=76761 RepID=UPI001072226C